MNSLRHILRCTVLVAAFALGFATSNSFAATEAEELGQPAGTVMVPNGLSSDEVKEAIVMTLAARQWIIQSKTDDRLVASLKHRSNEATLTLIYTTEKVDLYCVGWEINKKTGVREKPEQPTGWLKYIRNDLTKHFTRISGLKK